MVAFYRDVLGLKLLSGDHRAAITFFRIAEGFGGHTSVLALFHHAADQWGVHPQSADAPQTGARSSLHHLALTVRQEDQDAAMGWFEECGITFRVEHFDWIGWRGVFITDPEGNTVELVAADPAFEAT